MLPKEYFTVLNEAKTQFEEKKSKFISYVKPVETEKEALEFIDTIKSRHWDASHNVYAYDILGDSAIQRYSDDGEPQGTAGLPAMELIKKSGIRNVVIVITRYFGGTLLGAAGLIRAYGKSASMGIEEANIVKKVLCREYHVKIDYNLSGKVQNGILSNGYIINGINYTEDVEFIVPVPEEKEEEFRNCIVDATFDRAVLKAGEKFYSTFR